MDRQVAGREDKELADLLEKFVCVRISWTTAPDGSSGLPTTSRATPHMAS